MVRQETPCFVYVSDAFAVFNLTINLSAARNGHWPADAIVNSFSPKNAASAYLPVNVPRQAKFLNFCMLDRPIFPTKLGPICASYDG